MKRGHILSIVSMAVLIGTMSSTARAAITVHTDLNSWRSSLGYYDTETFNDTVLNPGVSVATTNGGFSGNLWHDLVTPSGATTTWTFDTPINAWGADFWNLAGPGGPGTGIIVSLDGVAAPVEIASSQSSGFWGLTSTTGFSQVLLEIGTQAPPGSQETYEMDNMSYSTVPAPGALVLGLLGVGITRRLKKRKLV